MKLHKLLVSVILYLFVVFLLFVLTSYPVPSADAIPLPRGAKIPDKPLSISHKADNGITRPEGRLELFKRWNLEKGFPIPEDSADWRETQWSAWLAEQIHGIPEARTYTGQRVDILIPTTANRVGVAIEVGWAKESVIAQDIGQTRAYAHMTYTTPAIIWLSDDSFRARQAVKVMQAKCQQNGIKLYIQRVTDKTKN